MSDTIFILGLLLAGATTSVLLCFRLKRTLTEYAERRMDRMDRQREREERHRDREERRRARNRNGQDPNRYIGGEYAEFIEY